MLVTQKLGNIRDQDLEGWTVAVVVVAWHETRKRILHKATTGGVPVTMKFLADNPDFKDGDIIYKEGNQLTVIEIAPCECCTILPRNSLEAAAICYEIGNRHLPLFYEADELLTPYDLPIFNLLQRSGFTVRLEERKLCHAFNSSVLPHLQLPAHGNGSNSIRQYTISS